MKTAATSKYQWTYWRYSVLFRCSKGESKRIPRCGIIFIKVISDKFQIVNLFKDDIVQSAAARYNSHVGHNPTDKKSFFASIPLYAMWKRFIEFRCRKGYKRWIFRQSKNKSAMCATRCGSLDGLRQTVRCFFMQQTKKCSLFC